MLSSVSVLAVLCLLASPALATNLCATNNGGCGPNAYCHGTTSVSCSCHSGYYMTTSGCVAVNPCATSNGGCHANADCSGQLATYGPVTCTCKPGFRGPGHNGYYCPTEENACATANGGCGTHANCYGGLSGNPVSCACHDGYYLSGGSCVAVDACATNNGGCHANAQCQTTVGTYEWTCTCNTGYHGSGQYCEPDQMQGGGGGGGGPSTGGEAVVATGLEFKRRMGNCGPTGSNTCPTGPADGGPARWHSYVQPCDVAGAAAGLCDNTPTSVQGFLLEVDPFNFPSGFEATQYIPQINYGPEPTGAPSLGLTADSAAVVSGYIFGGRNQDAHLVGAGDDVFRVMCDFNRNGAFSADEWGGAPVTANNGVTYTITNGHFDKPGCYRLKGGYYNGPTNTQFSLFAAETATPNLNDAEIQNTPRFGPEYYFKTLGDCPVCSCAAGSFISADCTPTKNAVCTPCCNPSQCDGTTLADPTPDCEPEEPEPQNPHWDCPNVATNEWEWRYDEPTCEALRVVYPTSLPAGQANDVNIRITYPGGEVTLNFHLNNGYWSGEEVFYLQQHPNWPRNVATYSVVWVQVAGTNCHWTGSVNCCQHPGEGGGVLITPAPCSSEPPMAPTENPPTNPHEWTYPPPVCTGVTVNYPIWLPDGHSNDVNVRVYFPELGRAITFNFHKEMGVWTGSVTFNFVTRMDWPSMVTQWIVEWVQVGGTNFHWNGQTNCPVTP